MNIIFEYPSEKAFQNNCWLQWKVLNLRDLKLRLHTAFSAAENAVSERSINDESNKKIISSLRDCEYTM